MPCGPINDLDEVFANEQVRRAAWQIDLPHPTAGKVKLVRSPMQMSATPATSDTAPPLLGQHTDEVLRGGAGQERTRRLPPCRHAALFSTGSGAWRLTPFYCAVQSPVTWVASADRC